MDDRRKNTRAYVRENLEIPLYTKLENVAKKFLPKKKGESSHTWKPRDNVQY